jgi:hypothetical protein
VRTRNAVAGIAAAAFVVRMVFLGAPVSSDEAGLLMVGGQWAPGQSLYGDYWVDRPPGLVAVASLADALGGLEALRVLAAVAVAAAVLAAAWLGAVVAPDRRWAPVACAAVVGVLASNPLLDADEVSAEILALPFLLAGLGALVHAVEPRQDGRWWGLAAGAAAAVAVLLKQNLVEVGVAMAVLGVGLAVRGEGRRAAGLAGTFAAGAVLVAVPLLVLAAARGTSATELWEAVVAFRFEAGAVIAEDASADTPVRARQLGLAFLATGMPVLLLLVARLPWRGDPALAATCLAILGWELVAVVAGGSYWLHYLLLPLPGLVLLVAAAMRHPRPLLPAVLLPAAASTLIALVYVHLYPFEQPDEEAVAAFLAAHRDEGTSAVIGFGRSEVLHEAGMTSPYEHLWSLPVRVLDPDASGLVSVREGPDRPDWVVRIGDSMSSWGIDASDADEVLERDYEEVFSAGRYTVFASRRP